MLLQPLEKIKNAIQHGQYLRAFELAMMIEKEMQCEDIYPFPDYQALKKKMILCEFSIQLRLSVGELKNNIHTEINNEYALTIIDAFENAAHLFEMLYLCYKDASRAKDLLSGIFHESTNQNRNYTQSQLMKNYTDILTFMNMLGRDATYIILQKIFSTPNPINSNDHLLMHNVPNLFKSDALDKFIILSNVYKTRCKQHALVDESSIQNNLSFHCGR